jgi:Rieske Fe-S protein
MNGPRSNPGTTWNDTTDHATGDAQACDGCATHRSSAVRTTDTGTTGAVATLTQLGVTRRNVVLGASVVGAAGLLAACGGGSSTASGGGSSTASSGGSTGSTAPSASSSDDKGGNSGGGEKLASKSDVPVGGGSINQDAKVVVTQPTAGSFKAFTAVCTHMNCLVAQVSNNVITCFCHGSQYSAVNGSVESGPAPRPLAPVAIKVEGDDIVQA